MPEKPISFNQMEQQRLILEEVRESLLRNFIAAGLPQNDCELSTDLSKLSLATINLNERPRPQYSSERFFFKGELLVPNSLNGFSKFEKIGTQEIATITDINIPIQLQNHNIGKEIVTTWENAWKTVGIKTFMAKGIRKPAREFWEKIGYRVLVSNVVVFTFGNQQLPQHMIKMM